MKSDKSYESYSENNFKTVRYHPIWQYVLCWCCCLEMHPVRCFNLKVTPNVFTIHLTLLQWPIYPNPKHFLRELKTAWTDQYFFWWNLCSCSKIPFLNHCNNIADRQPVYYSNSFIIVLTIYVHLVDYIC